MSRLYLRVVRWFLLGGSFASVGGPLVSPGVSLVSSGGSLLSFGHLFDVAGTVCAVLFCVSCC